MTAATGRMSRRTFLRRTVWLAAAGTTATLAAGVAGNAIGLVGVPGPAARLATALGGQAVAARVGRSAIQAGVVPAHTPAMFDSLRRRVPNLDLILRDGSDDDVRLAIDAARWHDFASVDDGTVRLEGWVVARAEALACALVAVAAA